MTDAMAAIMAEQGVAPEDLPMSLETLLLIQLAFNLPIGLAINAVFLLSEELGWRGWLWDRWSGLGFWRNAALTGVVWGLWHAPIIALGHNYPGMPVTGILLMTGFTMLISPVLHLCRARGGTVFHASVFHGTINGLAGFSIILVSNPVWPWNGAVGIGGFAVLAISVAGTAFYLRLRPTPSPAL